MARLVEASKVFIIFVLCVSSLFLPCSQSSPSLFYHPASGDTKLTKELALLKGILPFVTARKPQTIPTKIKEKCARMCARFCLFRKTDEKYRACFELCLKVCFKVES